MQIWADIPYILYTIKRSIDIPLEMDHTFFLSFVFITLLISRRLMSSLTTAVIMSFILPSLTFKSFLNIHSPVQINLFIDFVFLIW